MFSEVSEVEMTDVIGGGCGGGGWMCGVYMPCSSSYYGCSPVGPGAGGIF